MTEGAEIKYMDIKEFMEKGFLQEVNRQFFHPLGLALEVVVDKKGNHKLGNVWDYRDDPEGMFFSNKDMATDMAKEKADNVNKLRKSKIKARKDFEGVETDRSGIQKLP